MCEDEEKPGGGVALGGATGGKGKKKGKRSRGHKVDKSADEGPRGKTEVRVKTWRPHDAIRCSVVLCGVTPVLNDLRMHDYISSELTFLRVSMHV